MCHSLTQLADFSGEYRVGGWLWGLSYPEDYDLAIKWYERGVKFEAIQDLTLYWREHPGRTSRNSNSYSQRAFFELKINAFLNLDYRGGPLVIWGKNPKSKLISKILKGRGIAFEIQDLEDYESIEKLENPQLLVAVYPPEKERIEIQKYLMLIGMKEGTDWWWV
ncbi:hypothetical protein [Algoriphagus hitonicola]|uniref:hypothetical protein n=1 Tax=Algoriphagus hitonicola TaxID=435880 RepID=UPI00361892CC